MTTSAAPRTSFKSHTNRRISIQGVVIVGYNRQYKFVYGTPEGEDQRKNYLLNIPVESDEEGECITSILADLVDNLVDNNIGVPKDFNWDVEIEKYTETLSVNADTTDKVVNTNNTTATYTSDDSVVATPTKKAKPTQDG